MDMGERGLDTGCCGVSRRCWRLQLSLSPQHLGSGLRELYSSLSIFIWKMASKTLSQRPGVCTRGGYRVTESAGGGGPGLMPTGIRRDPGALRPDLPPHHFGPGVCQGMLESLVGPLASPYLQGP